MKEIDFLPKWYKTGKRRQVNYRRQYIVIAGIFITLIAWSFSASLSISVVEAQVEMMHDSLKNNQQIANGYTVLQGSLGKLEEKKDLLERLGTGVKISSMLAEISYLVDKNITLTNLNYKSEAFVPENIAFGSSVRRGRANSGMKDAMPSESIRFKVAIKGVADNAADVTAFMKRLGQSEYLCQIIPVILRNIKNTSAAEFEINCYVANYIIE
ncbi:MAG: PilN domain-containing protein [Planctomycetes bacterium]|nr:PilN domain-containing protein [Planctomycetota bacterium]